MLSAKFEVLKESTISALATLDTIQEIVETHGGKLFPLDRGQSIIIRVDEAPESTIAVLQILLGQPISLSESTQPYFDVPTSFPIDELG